MESAIAEGDYAKAEELSDRLATREVCHADKPSWGGAPTVTNRANGSATTLPTKDTEATNTPPHGRRKTRERARAVARHPQMCVPHSAHRQNLLQAFSIGVNGKPSPRSSEVRQCLPHFWLLVLMTGTMLSSQVLKRFFPGASLHL